MKFIFLILIAFPLFFSVTGQVQAALGTPCGDASGKVSSADGSTLKDESKNWVPDERWKEGKVKITGGTGSGQERSVEKSTKDTITVSAKWDTKPDTTSTYIVQAKTDACLVMEADGTKNVFGCQQVGDQGYCGGPCRKSEVDAAPTLCQTKIGTPLGWKASTCTAVNDTSNKPGSCVELPASQLSKGPQSGTALLDIVDVVTNWVFAIFTVLAIIFVLLAAFQFVTAGGQAEKVGEARQKLIWAAVGIIIALLSKGLVPVIRSIIGG